MEGERDGELATPLYRTSTWTTTPAGFARKATAAVAIDVPRGTPTST
jgi:hypothetical protein